VRELGFETCVRRNDELTIEDVLDPRPSHLIVSPGPCTPNEAGISNELIAAIGKTTPTLGVCLGHQCIAAAYGARVVRAERPMHGKTSLIHHDGTDVFRGLPNPFPATRYHSLLVEPDSVPTALQITARTADGAIMGLRHREHPVVGVQFHPESVLTQCGYDLLRNFLHGMPCYGSG
jgi:anthranilate synthase/aminodeoxychorismate synthase-like glutamine amidotransferase